jgi:hypothetical protein
MLLTLFTIRLIQSDIISRNHVEVKITIIPKLIITIVITLEILTRFN